VSEPARKAVHVGAGLLALLLPWLTRWEGLGICAGAFLINWQVLPRITGRRLERPEDLSRGYARGIILYPLAVGSLFLLFGSRMEVVAAAWGILAFGDGFATLAGQGVGGPALPWNSGKTYAGFIAFVAAGGSAATMLYLWTAPGADPGTAAALCFSAALLGALIEGVPTGIDDNITVPLMTGGFLFAMTFVQAARLQAGAQTLTGNLLLGLVVNLVISGLALGARTVSRSGAVAGFLIGVAVFTFGGWQAFVVLMLFFVLASGATKVGYERKAARRIAQEDGGRRGARHAVANCGVPAFLAFLAAATPWSDAMMVALVAALATAVFDTVSSEIGQVYGRHPFLITTFRPVPAGTDGAVSVEGTLAGLAAAAALAGAALSLGLTGSLGWRGAAVAVVAAFIGTTMESYLGAATRSVDNEAMNFANTLAGALVALALCALVLS